MLLHNIMGLDDGEQLFLIEDSYTSLNELYQSLGYMEQMAKSGVDTQIRVLEDQDRLVCLAVHNPETEDYPAFWAVFTSVVARTGITSQAAEIFEELAAAIISSSANVTRVHITTRDLEAALREYFSLALVNRQLCDGCVKAPESYEMVYLDQRVDRLVRLIEGFGDWFDGSDQALEIACGNGMATPALENMGIFPLTTDYDKCMICQGLEYEVLKPQRSIVMDATRLSHFFSAGYFDAVIGFMLGTIYSFNKDMWAAIMSESLRVLRSGGQLLFTVNKPEEMDILKEVLDGLGARGEVIDNTDEHGIYDQWVYLGRKES